MEMNTRIQVEHPVTCLLYTSADFEALEALTLGGLRKAVQDGDTRNGSLMAGQSAGLVKESLSCREIISRMVSRAEDLMIRKPWQE